MLLFPYETHLTNAQKKRKSNKTQRLENPRRKRDWDEGRTGRGEDEGDRNKDRGKQIEGVSGRVGGNQEVGDHSMGTENWKIISVRYAFAQERERTGGRKRPQGTVPVPAPRAENASPRPCHFGSATQMSLHDGARWIPAEYSDERVRSLGPLSRPGVPPLSHSFQLQGGLYSCRARPPRAFHPNAATRRHRLSGPYTKLR